MNTQLTNRIKSLIWRAGGMAVVAVGAYILQVGDIFLLDVNTLINIGILTFIGLVVSEVTKYLNN